MPSNKIDKRAVECVQCPLCKSEPGKPCAVPASWNAARQQRLYVHTERREAYRRFRDGDAPSWRAGTTAG